MNLASSSRRTIKHLDIRFDAVIELVISKLKLLKIAEDSCLFSKDKLEVNFHIKIDFSTQHCPYCGANI